MCYSSTTCNCTRRRSTLSYQVGSFLSSDLRSFLTKGEIFMCSRTKASNRLSHCLLGQKQGLWMFKILALGTTNRDVTSSGEENKGEEEEWRDTCFLGEPGNALVADYKRRRFSFWFQVQLHTLSTTPGHIWGLLRVSCNYIISDHYRLLKNILGVSEVNSVFNTLICVKEVLSTQLS